MCCNLLIISDFTCWNFLWGFTARDQGSNVVDPMYSPSSSNNMLYLFSEDAAAEMRDCREESE